MKRIFTAIICASAMFACTPSSQPVHTAANVPTADRADTASAAGLPANLQATDKKLEVQEPFGKFDFTYPSFGVAEIDKTIENVVKNAFESSKSELSQRYEEMKDNLPAEELQGYHHTMEYEVVRTGADGVDIVFTHEGYTGGAHGFFYVSTLMLDKSGKKLALSDLYEDVPAALNRLSEESRRILPGMMADIEDVDEMLKGGTEPNLDNFSEILRTDKGLRVYFNPYQVAPWAVGMLMIDVDK